MANLAYDKLFRSGHLTLGLMMPAARKPGQHADVAIELAVAKRAGHYGFSALWASHSCSPHSPAAEHAMLDDPFVLLAAMGAAAPDLALVAQVALSRCDVTQVARSAHSLQRISGGRCVLGLAEADGTEPRRLQLEQALAAMGSAQLATLQIDGPLHLHPAVRQLCLTLDERADAPRQPAPYGLRGGRLALLAELERLAESGVAHVLIHLARNGRPTLDLIDELGTDIIPRLQIGVTQ